MITATIAAEIRQRVAAEVAQLPPNLRKWSERHIVARKIITALLDPDRSQTVEVLLVTDDTGKIDCSVRIVFDSRANRFGRLTTLEDGRLWYQGPQEGGFADAVKTL